MPKRKGKSMFEAAEELARSAAGAPLVSEFTSMRIGYKHGTRGGGPGGAAEEDGLRGLGIDTDRPDVGRAFNLGAFAGRFVKAVIDGEDVDDGTEEEEEEDD